MKYNIQGGEYYLAMPKGCAVGINRGTIEMTEKVSVSDLQKAADVVYPMFPFFNVKAVFTDGQYVFETVDKAYTVYESEERIDCGDERINGYLLAVGCYENKIYCDFFHGLMDGRANEMFKKNLVYYYCAFHYGREFACDGILPVGTVLDSDKYYRNIDYDSIPVSPAAYDFKVPAECFTYDHEECLDGDVTKVYRVSAPQKEFMAYTKAHDGSPAVISSLFLSRAIDRVNPGLKLPIVTDLIVDVRNAIDQNDSLRCMISTIYLVYDDRMRKLPLGVQATCFRGMVFAQSTPEILVPRFLEEQKLYSESYQNAINKKCGKTYDDSKIVTNEEPYVSYIGNITFGELDQYRKDFACEFAVESPGMVIQMFVVNDTINMVLLSSLKSDKYYDAFISELKDAGIEYKTEAPHYINNPHRAF